MFEILKLGICPSPCRIGWITVKYHNLIMRCNICLYRKEKLFIRMPEVYLDGVKYPFTYWVSKKESDTFQKEMLKMLKKSIGLDLQKALSLLEEWKQNKKEGDRNKKSI